MCDKGIDEDEHLYVENTINSVINYLFTNPFNASINDVQVTLTILMGLPTRKPGNKNVLLNSINLINIPTYKHSTNNIIISLLCYKQT